MANMARSKKILLIMVACAVVAVVFGLLVMKNRISNTPPQAQTNNNTDSPTPPPTPPPAAEDTSTTTVIPSDWKVYTNDKHQFTVQYPPALKAGSISDNSVLGTFQSPVRGYHVGPLVFVVLKDASIKKDAQDLFKGVYDAAKNPTPVADTPSGEVPPVQCKILLDTVDKKAVSCNGEGGAAKYAYITGTYDVLIDGYSKGYDTQANGELKNDTDFLLVLKSFSFGITPATTPNPSPTSTNPTPSPSPAAIQSFTISADDSAATPNAIAVTKDSIVQITFNVAATNVYYGGLDFKSSIVNSGTIHSGESKTISFKATESFQFTPYWPSSSIAKPYKISVTVQ